MSLLEVRNVKKVYTTRLGANQVQALSNVNFSVEDGEYVAIMGESGSGKTTPVSYTHLPTKKHLQKLTAKEEEKYYNILHPPPSLYYKYFHI